MRGGSHGGTSVVGVWLGTDQDNGLNLSVTAAVASDLLDQANNHLVVYHNWKANESS